jgi:hypothetical protein
MPSQASYANAINETKAKNAAQKPKRPAPNRIPLTKVDNHYIGGKCLGCGGSCEVWFNYQLCRICVNIRPNAVTGPGYTS